MKKRILSTTSRGLCAVLLSVLFLSTEIQAATVTVHVGPGIQMLYSPDPVSIAVGDTIHWVWDSTGLIRHSVTSGVPPNPDGLFDSGEFPMGHTFDFTFTTAGNVPYFCTVHGIMMTGLVEVATATPTPPPTTPTPTPAPTATPTPTPTPTPTSTPATTPTPTPAATPTPTSTPVPTPTPSATPTPPTPSPTPTAAPTATPTPPPTPTPTPTAAPGTFGNISTRLRVETGDNVLIGGFIITGTQPKRIIVRAIGPSLSSFFPGALADPTLELRDSSGSLIRSNDNWRSDQEAEIIATTIAPSDDLESAIVATLPANGSAYTAIVRGVNNGTGIGVVEAYDLNQAVDSKLANISTRGLVQTGDNVMIGGMIVLGQNPLRVIVRAIGPSLPVPGALGDPTLELRDGNGALLAANDNWRSDQEAEIIATTIPPSNDLESAIVRNLPPGNYTAIVRGANNTTGVAVVEAYNLN
jgi:plastocyanin